MDLKVFKKKTLDLHTLFWCTASLPLLMLVGKNVTSRFHAFLYQNQSEQEMPKYLCLKINTVSLEVNFFTELKIDE